MSYFTLLKIWDGTNGPAAVKPASTAAVASDPALVVAISPNNVVPVSSGTVAVNSQTWLTGVGGTSAQITVTGYNTVLVTLNGSGTITTGTAVYEVSDDGGTTWFAITGRGGNATSTGSSSNLAATLSTMQFNVAGFTTFRVRNSVTITGSGGQSIIRAQASDAVFITSVDVANMSGGNIATTGTLTHNNAAPAAATNIGALTAIANAAVPTFTEGDVVFDSLDLQGSQRTRPGSPTTANWLQAVISVSALGANVIIPAVGGQTVRVMRMFFVNSDSANATNITIQDTNPTSFSGAFRLITGGSFNGADSNGEPLYVSAIGKGIQLNSSVAVQLSGTVWYTQS